MLTTIKLCNISITSHSHCVCVHVCMCVHVCACVCVITLEIYSSRKFQVYIILNYSCHDPWAGRSPGEGNGNPLQYSCLETPMDTRTWWVTVHGGARVGHNLTT